MTTIRQQSMPEYRTALRALRTDSDRADFVRHRARALAEDIDSHVRDETGAVVLEPEQYRELQWLLAMLDAWDHLVAELRRRAFKEADAAEQERVGALTES